MTAITMKSFVTRGKDHTNVAEREAVFSIEGDELAQRIAVAGGPALLKSAHTRDGVNDIVLICITCLIVKIAGICWKLSKRQMKKENY